MSQPQPEQLAAWTQRLQAADLEAFAALFTTLYPDLLRYARQRTARDGPSEDAVQEAFLRLWERRASLDPSRSIKAFLYVTVRNFCLNHQRNTTTRSTLLTTMPSRTNPSDPADQLDTDQMQHRIRTWIQELPERRREAFELSRFAGLSYQEIAHVMNLSTKTVEKHITGALRHLRTRLRAYDPDLLL
ncbi:MAG TPA: RNA polymerase sigma-70 factor [Rhodothermales bacterium]|nr:RNA polymerase sigma-70 factor [Rhodothermales bacterium]